MSHSLPAYRVNTRQRLSWFTEETLMGALLPMLVPPLYFLAPVTALAGAMVGRARIVRENQEGKIVPPPSLLNKTMFLGLLIGLGAMTGVGLLAGVGVLSVSTLLAGELATGTAGAATLLAAAAAVVTSTYYGGVQGRHRMEAEYHYARMYGEPMDGHMQEVTVTPQKTIDMFEDLNLPQKKYVLEEMRRRTAAEEQKTNYRA